MFHHVFCRKQWDNSKPYIFLSDIPTIIWNILCTDIALSYKVIVLYFFFFIMTTVSDSPWNSIKHSQVKVHLPFSFNSYFWPLKWVQCQWGRYFSKLLYIFSLLSFLFHSGWLRLNLHNLRYCKATAFTVQSLEGNVMKLLRSNLLTQ